MEHVVTASFNTRSSVENALRGLEDIGITNNQIVLIASDETRKSFDLDDRGLDDGDNSDEGAAAGAAAGGILGATFGGLLTAGAIAIPGLNLVVSGALFGALAGLLTGAGAGGLVGALIGAGLSEDEAQTYEDEIRAGNVVISVQAENDTQENRVRDILDRTQASVFGDSMIGSRTSPQVRNF